MTAAVHRGAGHGPGRPAVPGVTEVRGPAQDLHAELFGAADRPVAQGYGSPEETAAAVQGARTSIEVHGGGSVAVDTSALHDATAGVSRIGQDLGDVLAALGPLTAELELWALTGQPLLGDAAAAAALLTVDLVGCVAHVGLTGTRLAFAAQRYEAVEHAVLGMFSETELNSAPPTPSSVLRSEAARTAEALEAALTRADITSVTDFADSVRFSAFGVVVKGGGPNGTDAVIRGPGADDILDPLLQVSLPFSADPPGEGGDGAGASGAPSSDGSAGDDGTRSSQTLGQHLRGWLVDVLRGYGDPVSAAPEPVWTRQTGAALAAAVLHAQPLPPWFRVSPTGGSLPLAARLDARVRAAARPWLGAHALRPSRREVFTGLTPGNAAAHHMTGRGQRPLPRGVDHDGAVPTTVASTAAALKDAKNIVSGAGPDGEEVENSTVMVQKSIGEGGRTAYSVVLTGTEEWSDSPGVHDIKGIGDGITAPPTAALTELPQAQRMAVQALRDAGIRTGDTVVLTGHSLGGIDAAGLAANHEFRTLYDVRAVTTFGAPVGDFDIPESTSVMAVEHVDDVVPALDGVPNPDSAHRSTVRVDTPYPDSLTVKGGRGGTAAHEMSLYTLGAQGISAAEHHVVQAHEQRLATAVPHGPGTRTETYVYEGVEEH